MRQELHWVDSSRRVSLPGKPKRVWTVIDQTLPFSKPELPMTPVHLQNAFMEDHVHDWTMVSPTTMQYYSRVAKDSVWILCEFED